MSGVSEETDITKSKICIVGSIIFVILGLSFAFIWSGSIFYGLVLLGLPVVTIILTTYCYVTQDPEEVWHTPNPAAEGEDQNTNSARLNDRPPSYRMTWRRSFIKKFRRTGPETSPPITANETFFGETETLTRNTTRFGSPQETETSDKLDGSPRFKDGIAVAVEDSSGEEDDDVRELSRDNSTNNDKNIKKSALNAQQSLPTYEEAVIIMKSSENLSN